MRRLGMALLLASGCLLPAAAHGQAMRVYPAMQSGSVGYVISVAQTGLIAKCRPIDQKVPAAVAKAACDKLTAKGVPASVTPATSITPPATWVSSDDLPPDKFRKNASVEMMFEVNSDGRVSDCTAYVTSGDPEFDVTVCAAVIVRARFRPATYEGQPVPAVTIMHFNYTKS